MGGLRDLSASAAPQSDRYIAFPGNTHLKRDLLFGIARHTAKEQGILAEHLTAAEFRRQIVPQTLFDCLLRAVGEIAGSLENAYEDHR